MRWTWSALAVGFLAMLACGERTDERDPGATFSAAVERTLAAESFQIRSTVTDGREKLVSQIDYVAPDRVRVRLRPTGQTVSIAGETYYATPEEPGRFVLVETGCTTLEAVVPALRIVRDATDVRRDGPVFGFRADDVAGMTGQARIEDGYFASLTLRYDLPGLERKVIEQYSFARFGEAISIERPSGPSVIRTPGASLGQISPAPCPVARPPAEAPPS